MTGRAPTPAAKRQRRHRTRRAAGVRVVLVEIGGDVIQALIQRGWLSEADIGDRQVLAEALADLAECWADDRLTASPIVIGMADNS